MSVSNVHLETASASVTASLAACERLGALNVNPVDAYLLCQILLPFSYLKQRHEDAMKEGTASLLSFGFSMPENVTENE
jgi:hypothetical protein